MICQQLCHSVRFPILQIQCTLVALTICHKRLPELVRYFQPFNLLFQIPFPPNLDPATLSLIPLRAITLVEITYMPVPLLVKCDRFKNYPCSQLVVPPSAGQLNHNISSIIILLLQ